MKQRNPASHRLTERNEARTAKQVERYHGLNDLLRTWESMPDEVQITNHSYILEVKRKCRNTKNLLLHRSTPEAGV
jgi:hypothetical protein